MNLNEDMLESTVHSWQGFESVWYLIMSETKYGRHLLWVHQGFDGIDDHEIHATAEAVKGDGA